MLRNNHMFYIKRVVNTCIRNAHDSIVVKGSDLFARLPKYESPLSLKNIYPKSSLSITAVKKIPESSNKFSGYIPMNKLQTTFCRSSGPGGQNVNKVNSKVVVSFHLETADWIPLETRQKLAHIHQNNINKDGYWIIRSDKTRDQLLNKADCMDKLRCYIAEAEQPPPQPSFETLEKKRLCIERAAAERLRRKRHNSMLKSMRKIDL